MSASLSGYSAFPGFTPAIASDITGAANAYGISPDVLANVLASESSFNPQASNPSGASGIAQFMPSTASYFGVNAMDPTSSIYGAAEYLTQLGVNSNPAAALAAYGTTATPAGLANYQNKAAAYDPAALLSGVSAPGGVAVTGGATPAASGTGGAGGSTLANIPVIGQIAWIVNNPFSFLILVIATVGLGALVVGYAVKKA